MTISEVAEYLKTHDRYLLLTHRRPDGDTLGSAAALCRGLRSLGRTAFLYENPEVTENYLPWVKPLFAQKNYEYDCVVSVDIASEGLFPEGWSGKVQLSLDHHPSNSGYAEFTKVCGERASCGELIYELLCELCGGIDAQMAELLYVAVSTDTGCFCYANTDASCLRTAAALVEAGAQNGRLNKQLFRSKSRAAIQLEGEITAGMRFYQNGAVAIAAVTLEMMERLGATENDCEDLASIPGRVRGVKAGFMIRELSPGRSKFSARTTEEVNASDFCARFGGGGHKMAAGATVDASPEELREKILAAIDEIWDA